MTGDVLGLGKSVKGLSKNDRCSVQPMGEIMGGGAAGDDKLGRFLDWLQDITPKWHDVLKMLCM